MEPPNNGHGGDEHFVHCSEVVPSSEVLPLSTIIIFIHWFVNHNAFIYRLLHIIYILQCIYYNNYTHSIYYVDVHCTLP